MVENSQHAKPRPESATPLRLEPLPSATFKMGLLPNQKPDSKDVLQLFMFPNELLEHIFLQLHPLEIVKCRAVSVFSFHLFHLFMGHHWMPVRASNDRHRLYHVTFPCSGEN
jgi:hypothetical protein